MRAAAYIRVSTEEQAEYSPVSQRKRIAEYAIAHGLELLEEHIYLDEGISGRSVRGRASFLRMIAEAKRKPRPFDVILVWKFSRFARNRQDSILYKSMLRKECGIEVLSITEQLSNDPTAILIEALLEAMDEYYSINLAQEVKRGMNEKFSRGGVVSTPPFGYRMGIEGSSGTSVFVPDERTARYVRMIYRDFCGGMSPRQIALKLRDMKLCTARGNPFETRGVEYILSNPAYIGMQRRRLSSGTKGDRFKRGEGVTLVPGRHRPIIPKELFEEAQERLTQRSRAERQGAEKAIGTSYLLRGLVRCGSCGAVLASAHGAKALQCPRYGKGICGSSHYISLDKLYNCVLTQLERDLSPMGELPIRLDPGTSQWGRQEIDAALLLEEKNLERAYAAYEAGIDSIGEYAEKKRAIELRLAQWREADMRQKKEKAAGNLKITLGTVLSALRSPLIGEEVKNEVLRSILEKIEFSRPGNEVTLFYRF